jgi:hypothetical protein
MSPKISNVVFSRVFSRVINRVFGQVLSPIPAATLLTCVLVSGCGDDADPQERITKLRALGVEQSPTISKPGDTVSLTFHLAGPKELSLTFESFNDRAVYRYGTTTDVTLIDSSAQVEDIGALNRYAIRTQFIIPSDPLVAATIAAKGYARIRYGLTVRAGSEEEIIVGDTLVFAPGSPQLTWTAPVVAITEPTVSEIGTDASISGSIQSTNNERNDIGWFVSSGRVKIRGSIASEWQEAAAGEQTIIFTARGKLSGAFAFKTQKVTVR